MNLNEREPSTDSKKGTERVLIPSNLNNNEKVSNEIKNSDFEQGRTQS